MSVFQYDCVIFDLDGTILDTLDDLADSVNITLNRLNFPLRTRNEIRNFIGNGILNLVKRSLPDDANEKMIEKGFELFKSVYADNWKNKTQPYPHIISLFKSLKANQVKIAVASNKKEDVVQDLCDCYFPGYVSLAMGEQSGRLRKPAPDILYSVLKQLDCPKERAIYIGDSEVDVQTAQNAGIASIFVTWGFRDRKILEQFGGKNIVDSVDDLIAHLKNRATDCPKKC